MFQVHPLLNDMKLNISMFKYSYHQQSMKSQNNSWGVQPLSMDDGLELAQYTMIDFRHGTKVNIIDMNIPFTFLYLFLIPNLSISSDS